jgi:hypothetical protein
VTPWQELVTGALLGTERRPAGVPGATGALGAVLAGIDAGDQEGALLGAAAAWAVARRAGYRPAADDQPLDEPCPPDTARLVRPAAAARLATLLDPAEPAALRALLPEWLRVAAGAGLRPPAELLPDLLDRAITDPHLRPALLPVLGERGRWLAARNRDWSWAVAPAEADVERVFATGDRDAREAVLTRLRESDPGRARELLAGSWRGDPAAVRNELLATFSTGLSMADEGFLEDALDDRSAPVRATAARILAALPGSRHGERMAVRAKGRLIVAGRLRKRLEAAPALPPSPALIRDGVEPDPHQTWEAPAWWLSRQVGLTPLAAWEADTGLGPADLIRLAKAGDDERALLTGWATAARRQHDRRWIEALFDAGVWELSDALDPEVAAAILPARVRALTTASLTRTDELATLRRIFAPLAAPWPRDLGLEFLRVLAGVGAGEGRDAHTVIGHLLTRLDPDLAAEAAGLLLERCDPDDWRTRPVREAAALMTFRRRMHEELT